jgi:hypothetical protein
MHHAWLLKDIGKVRINVTKNAQETVSYIYM